MRTRPVGGRISRRNGCETWSRPGRRGGIVRKYRLHTFRGSSRRCQSSVADRPETPEHPLLHAQFPHLPQNSAAAPGLPR